MSPLLSHLACYASAQCAVMPVMLLCQCTETLRSLWSCTLRLTLAQGTIFKAGLNLKCLQNFVGVLGLLKQYFRPYDPHDDEADRWVVGAVHLGVAEVKRGRGHKSTILTWNTLVCCLLCLNTAIHIGVFCTLKGAESTRAQYSIGPHWFVAYHVYTRRYTLVCYAC